MKVWTVLIQQTLHSRRYILGVYSSASKAKKASEQEFKESDLYPTQDCFCLNIISEQVVK